jgi:hypothetical protein
MEPQVIEVFVPDFAKLLADIPEGDWVSISPDGKKVLAHGPDFKNVHEQAPDGSFVRKYTGALDLVAQVS